MSRLAREGTVLTNCHITAASCVPCRASLFKGYYPHVTGVLRNGQAWGRTWVEKLRDSAATCDRSRSQTSSQSGTRLGSATE